VECLPKQQEEQSKNEGKATRTFGDAVRDLRQQRLKRAHAAQDRDTFLQVYNQAKKRRIAQSRYGALSRRTRTLERCIAQDTHAHSHVHTRERERER